MLDKFFVIYDNRFTIIIKKIEIVENDYENNDTMHDGVIQSCH